MKITDSHGKPHQTEVHMVNTSVELCNTVKHKDKDSREYSDMQAVDRHFKDEIRRI